MSTTQSAKVMLRENIVHLRTRRYIYNRHFDFLQMILLSEFEIFLGNVMEHIY